LALLGKREAAEAMLREMESSRFSSSTEPYTAQGAIVWLIIGANDRARTAVAKLGSGTSLRGWDPSFERLLTKLSRSGKALGIIEAVKTWPDNAVKAQILSRLSVAAPAASRRQMLLFAATETAKSIESGPLLSTVLPELATAWVRIGGSRRARTTCEVCSATERLRIDAMLLEQHGSRAGSLPGGVGRVSLSNPSVGAHQSFR
jgi:hypothetical protein